MASLDMEGPYRLTTEKIDEAVTRASPGNYALGYIQDSTFCVCYVGRSDDNVNGRLKQWVGEKPNRYTHFKFSYATSPKAAFEKECRNYHDFGGSAELDNEYHPKRPEGTNWKCPICNIFD
uniref:GIY-YIG nuclease family protein n=1 Tax=candidate division CPR3 bacterium TaxID=2268181 RepID=A0A7V3J9S8_UNCC3